MQSLTKDPRDFRPRARVLGLQLGTIADPSGDDGRVLSVNGGAGSPLGPRGARRQAGPAGQAEGADRGRGAAHRGRARLVMAGERRGLSATLAPNYGATNGATPHSRSPHHRRPVRRRGATPSGVGMAPRHLLHLRNNMRRYASAVAGARLCRSPSPPGVTPPASSSSTRARNSSSSLCGLLVVEQRPLGYAHSSPVTLGCPRRDRIRRSRL